MIAYADMLRDIGGTGKLFQRVWRIRVRLDWHDKPASTVRHMLYLERRPTVQEAKQIEAAHLKWCGDKIEANRGENKRLYDSMRQAIAAMETSDPEFFEPHIEALRDALFPGRDGSREGRRED